MHTTIGGWVLGTTFYLLLCCKTIEEKQGTVVWTAMLADETRGEVSILFPFFEVPNVIFFPFSCFEVDKIRSDNAAGAL